MMEPVSMTIALLLIGHAPDWVGPLLLWPGDHLVLVVAGASVIIGASVVCDLRRSAP